MTFREEDVVCSIVGISGSYLALRFFWQMLAGFLFVMSYEISNGVLLNYRFFFSCCH